ncbi:uncharacterized protein LACBIDRAFT_299070 [Laccaria bicolor S238N-H82]|uniref:Predicted protein n=1 Tax=Laccaria bicolor (strain S238N-H82 / ATCC MYA-4686) TaxID=486041 RepID=B0DDY6_LACBS|nr:uncharacterized protein LACBIDRAFT_299070 [Laccaria bicolor S238N-H82]EDR07168.1 predicted protein [Laccaria bicolor S238N-H82]|eukprot:XP_001882099.1 predicted protein [Laccaria bicolor S238N-H82]
MVANIWTGMGASSVREVVDIHPNKSCRSRQLGTKSIPHIFHIHPTSTFSFPRTSLPTKDPTSIVISKPISNAVKRNAHPYYAMTTSTVTVSCSSSSPHHQVHITTLTQHHHIPSMPSPSAQVSPTKYKLPTGLVGA